MIHNLLSIDLEDYFHFIGSRYSYPPPLWDGLESHVQRMTDHLLLALGDHKATFFCLGWVAERFPELIRAIAKAGHEIASHGMYHERVFLLGRAAFRADAERSRKVLEDCCGKAVHAYRAPGFSVRPHDVWFFDAVLQAGYTVDSSLFPGLRTMGGIPRAPLYPHVMGLGAGRLYEIPVSTANFFGMRTAFCGGGFFRIFPYWYIRRQIQRINAEGQPAVVYLHPRDLDVHQPRIRLEPINSFLYYYGLAGAEAKWQKLMHDFAWMRFDQWVVETPGSGTAKPPWMAEA